MNKKISATLVSTAVLILFQTQTVFAEGLIDGSTDAEAQQAASSIAGALDADNPQENDPNLGSEPQLRLEAVTIIGTTGNPDRVSGSAHRIEKEVLEQYRYDDINRVLNFVPGVYLREEDGYGLRPNIGMRGASADRSQKVTLLEDGVLISPATYSAPAAYFFPLTSRMVGVEVFKGASSIQHGPQTIGGAINLISAPIPKKPAAMLDVAAGDDAYRRLHVRGGTQVDDVGVMGELIHLSSQGFKQLDGGGDTGFAKNELLLKASRRFGIGQLEARLGYADETSDETYLGLTEQDFRDAPNRRYRATGLDEMKWEWIGGRVNWTQPALGGYLQLTSYLHAFDRQWRKFNNFSGADIRDVLANPDTPFNQLLVDVLHGQDTDGTAGSQDDLRIGTNARDFISSGLQGRLNWEFGTEIMHALELGARLHHDRIRRIHDEFGFEQMNGALVQNALPRIITANNKANAEALAVWLRDEIRHGKWTFAPGLRIEAINTDFENYASNLSQTNEYVVVLPGASASVDLSEQLSLLAGVHKGFSPATPSLSSEVRPEEAINYEAGARWNGKHGRLEVIAFFNDYSNLTSTCTISSGCSPVDFDTQTNAGQVEIYGVEAGWNHRVQLTPAYNMPLAINYTFTQAEFREAFSSTDPQFGNVLAGFELPYIPEHRANANVGLATDAWGVNLSATYTSRMRDQAGSGAFPAAGGSDAATIVDLAAHWRLQPKLTLSGRLDNVFDKEYVVSRRPYGARPGKPLAFQLGLTYRY